MAKKKKNKQPAKKRDRGVKLDLEIGLASFDKKEEIEKECIEELKDVQSDNGDLPIKIKNNLLDKAELFKIRKGRNPKIEAIYCQIFMPNDTKKNLPERIENLNLLINKFPFFELKDKDEFKPVYYEEYCTPKNYTKIAQNYYQKIEKLNLKKDNLVFKTDEKLIIGLGSASVYETSLTLHHIYGVPYIPGSAVKGSFRSYLIEKYCANDEEATKKEWFIDIFGSEESQGKVIFFDAFPIEDLKIFKDIINPHYQDYYSDDKNKIYPTDDQSPVPIPFLVVEGKFKFVFGIKEDFEVNIKGNKKNVLKFVKEYLECSLKEFGIGAKTAVGYGYFEK
ncbi:MAG: type III-B CRISPR module RAMP protein Cmr6 [Nautiliaceae bacterium]